MKKSICQWSLVVFSLFFLSSCSKSHHKYQAKNSLDAPTIDVEVFRVSDISFPDQQYAISFWLSIDYADSAKISDFASSIRIPESKGKISVTKVYLTPDTVHKEQNLMLEVNCVMDKTWNVTGYPFDDQLLKIDILTPEFDTSQLVFHTGKDPISFQDINAFESGWIPDTAYTSKSISNEIYDTRQAKINSVFSFEVPIHRKNPGFIFWKLFAGMYIAFFVSFVACYINIKHFEPRFGLPVGGLFATIANKYIIEGFLPLTAKLTLVDWLHDITIFAIFLIIAFSAVLLKLEDQSKNPELVPKPLKILWWEIRAGRKQWIMEGIKRIRPDIFFGVYILMNLIVILFAVLH